MTTHQEALEAIRKLSEYCEGRDCHENCILCDLECNGFVYSDKELRIMAKETKRLEAEGKRC